MSNIRQWLEDEIKKDGEAIEAIVVGRHDNAKYEKGGPLPDENIILPANVGLSKLDVEYDSGFGGADCFPMIAWTATKVYFISEYDGATSLVWVPRNPTPIEPSFSGQSD